VSFVFTLFSRVCVYGTCTLFFFNFFFFYYYFFITLYRGEDKPPKDGAAGQAVTVTAEFVQDKIAATAAVKRAGETNTVTLSGATSVDFYSVGASIVHEIAPTASALKSYSAGFVYNEKNVNLAVVANLAAVKTDKSKDTATVSLTHNVDSDVTFMAQGVYSFAKAEVKDGDKVTISAKPSTVRAGVVFFLAVCGVQAEFNVCR
jgi:hypothetical protein